MSDIWTTGIPGPPGPAGPQGPAGPVTNFTVGSVTETLTPQVFITGSAPNLTLSFGLQRGLTGATGPAGDIANLTIGTITSGPAGASITGAAPNKVLNLVIPPGEVGPAGPRGTDSNLSQARGILSGNLTPTFPLTIPYTGIVNNSAGASVWEVSAPTRLIVPPLCFHAKIKGQVTVNLPDLGDGLVVSIRRNGVEFSATYESEGWKIGSRLKTVVQVISPDIPVAPGDYLELYCELVDATTATILASGTWFEITVSN